MKKLILLLFLILSFKAIARPSPVRSVIDILNDVYDEDNLAVKVDATVQLANVVMVEGDRTDFSSTNITTAAIVDLITLSSACKKISIFNNSGGDFILYADASAVGFIAPGQTGYYDFTQELGAVIGIKSNSGTVSTGILYLNFFN